MRETNSGADLFADRRSARTFGAPEKKRRHGRGSSGRRCRTSRETHGVGHTPGVAKRQQKTNPVRNLRGGASAAQSGGAKERDDGDGTANRGWFVIVPITAQPHTHNTLASKMAATDHSALPHGHKSSIPGAPKTLLMPVTPMEDPESWSERKPMPLPPTLT